ncbi:diguanylate cyclase domain-containing protein, partial [Streptomyces turgidiscabies]|uniref:diguanylate cyclase domain-containing protein n=1 Tax=Streptomyces turgidiscabies TaxID=85558 RepID=UPI0038F73C59
GDALLVAVGQRLGAGLAQGDTVARLGGDEFAVVLAGLESADQAAGVAEKIGQEVAQPISIDGESIRITCSIGIAVAPQDG